MKDFFPMPKSRRGRILMGTLLLVGGVLGFLPVLGFWMFPLGLMILSVDFSPVRRFRRKMTVGIMRRWHRIRPNPVSTDQ